ncbi:MAG: hypothetical protein VXY83_03655 [Pseudomonadota bacterium]|nr:hypothetical protein [Pseudomonadota bacterium]
MLGAAEMEILYNAIQEKQAELEESLALIQQKQQLIKDSYQKENHGEECLTQDDRACIQLEELSMQERAVHEELDILTQISKVNGTFEDIRLAARDAHTSLLESSGIASSLTYEEQKLSDHATKAENKHQELLLKYKRLKKMPPDNLSQEELLRIYLDIEHKIAQEKVRKDLFTFMAEHLLYEKSRSDDDLTLAM